MSLEIYHSVLQSVAARQPCQCSLRYRATSRLGHKPYRRRRQCPAASAAFAGSAHPQAALWDLAGGLCFDPACQRAADYAFALSIGLPLIMLTVAIALYFIKGEDSDQEQRTFQDPATGVTFEATPDQRPERDKFGKLAYKTPSGYTPWPVEADTEGERLRIAVGPKNKAELRTFVFERLLAQPSQIVSVSLPRPTGIILEEDKRRQRVVVAGFVEGSAAEQQSKVGKLQSSIGKGSAQPGDVLRALTCITLEYSTSALFGAKPATKMVTLYGADGQSWPQVMTALQRGALEEDGEITMIFERYAGNVN
ncbi:hypothetical protein WJX73_005761 [Symbiochloris irregularis]|uniref:Uncharacterized protein n=1 Tax=Symbiochloris irregularis TaxID=706552 RepID=A0AAW1NQZ0_9CHLO